MKIRVLGAHAPYAPANKACNGFLAESPEVKIMLDCGNGSFAKLQNYLDFRALDALVVSHYHPDHFHDYHCIRHAIAGSIRDGSRKKPLPVYAPGEENEAWREMSQWQGVFQLMDLEDYRQNPVRIGDMTLQFQKNHHPVTCYAVSLCQGAKKVIYTSDTSWYDELAVFADQALLMLCEASLLDAEYLTAPAKGHLTAGQAGALASRAGVKKLILTHLWPELDHQILLAQAKENYPGEVCLAQEGQLYDLL